MRRSPTTRAPALTAIFSVLHMAVFGAGGMVLAPSNWFPPFNVKDTLDLIEASRSTTAWVSRGIYPRMSLRRH